MAGLLASCLGCWSFIYLYLLISFARKSSCQCLNVPDLKANRHFHYNGKTLPLKIESSSRVSHQMTSHILKILLEEILGYENVEVIRNQNYDSLGPSTILNRLAGCPYSGCFQRPGDMQGIPRTMINLEVWMPPGFNMETWVKYGYIVDAGPLGPTGRHGWYMPSYLVEEQWQSEQQIIDHWRALQLDPVSRMFAMEQDKLQLLQDVLTLRDMPSNYSYCQYNGCHRGLYSIPYCRHKKRNCPLLLSGDPNLDPILLQDQVRLLGLNVSIAWIGDHLSSFVADRTKKRLPSLFFNWEPNTLTAHKNYTRVQLPACLPGSEEGLRCDYPQFQLSKAMWITLKTHTPPAYHLISKMHFTQQQYEEMLRLYSKQKEHNAHKIQDIACLWLRQNEKHWKEWLPGNLASKQKIYIGGMFPITGPFVRQPGTVPGAQMALEYVNQDPTVLPNYELVMLIRDTQCKADIVMKQFMHFIVNETHPIAGILGPGCSETTEPIAGVSKHFNTVIVSYGANAITLGDRELYPFFFRTIPQTMQYGVVYQEIMNQFGWKQVSLLAEDGQGFPEFHTFLEDNLLQRGITVVYHRKMPRQATAEDAIKYVEGLKKTGSHIIILTSLEYSARAVICQAYKARMTAEYGYQWFMPAWFTDHWWNTTYFNQLSFTDEHVPCTPGQMFQAVKGHMSLSSAAFAPPDTQIIGNITVSEWNGTYRRALDILKLRNKRSPFATYAYDAVWVLALGLHHLLQEDPTALESLHTDATTERFLSYLNNTNFMGVSGPVQFSGADRIGIINIHQSMGNTSTLIGQHFPDRNASEKTQLNMSQIMWLTGSVPSDGGNALAKCSVEAFRRLLGVDCDSAITIANILGVGLFAITMLIGLFIVKKRYDRKVKETHERMRELGLLTDASWLCLDQWEVSRDNVVLNRKLGEGAFGTVYGGEALINECWVAVAVKTLKIGSNPEEKLDFLSEAEMMKRFDHENIVKLLGVCTRGEPAYTIMEFMLHGDLKTFLLARRQLVGLDSKEAEDITSDALTRMSLDVAHGLKYLTDLKYVHRDLACRNCLVHASKRVKIGDFGMTRPMYDSDYYRFNKRGMLPVRWMAPESLMDGLFTPMSDMWSFGVLLYEIMTFGSFPYQGMSNKQVLEHVKKGNNINLPPHCSHDLKMMLLSCWAYEPECRPEVDEVVEQLTLNSQLVVPCLDAPLSAVAIEGTESLELAIANPNRQSTSSHKLKGMRTAGAGGESIIPDRCSSGQSPTSASIVDPFSLLTSGHKSPDTWRNSNPRGDNCSELSGASDKEASTPCLADGVPSSPPTPEMKRTPSGCSHKTAPESPVTLRYIAIPNCNDSDYYSDHSKEFWNFNGANV